VSGEDEYGSVLAQGNRSSCWSTVAGAVSCEANWPRSRIIMTKFQNTVYLISCVSKKRATPSKARDLFTSDWFLKARDCVERTRSPWFILSAEHGLVPPDLILGSYERTLNAMSVADRKAWAAWVKAQMDTSLPAADRIIVFAGLRYREYLMDYLRQRARIVEVPMEGLTIGRQLHYLEDALHHEHMWSIACMGKFSAGVPLSVRNEPDSFKMESTFSLKKGRSRTVLTALYASGPILDVTNSRHASASISSLKTRTAVSSVRTLGAHS
jgi:hypothetical protein